jgi:hypothetical protein
MTGVSRPASLAPDFSPRREGFESSKARSSKTHSNVSAGLRPDRLRDVAHPHAARRQALSLLCQPVGAEARARGLPSRTYASLDGPILMLFGTEGPERRKADVVWLAGNGELDCPVIDASRYQDCLEALWGRTEDGTDLRCVAFMVPAGPG